MARNNWAESFANDLELCVYIGKHWAIFKDGTNQKGLFKKIDVSSQKFKDKRNQLTPFNDELYENVCDLPSLYFEGEEFEGGVVLCAKTPKFTSYFLIGNADKTPHRVEGSSISMKKDENLLVFYDNLSKEDILIYDTYSFAEVSHSADGQLGFNI